MIVDTMYDFYANSYNEVNLQFQGLLEHVGML